MSRLMPRQGQCQSLRQMNDVKQDVTCVQNHIGHLTLSSSLCTVITPGLSCATVGTWPGITPKSPVVDGSSTMSTCARELSRTLSTGCYLLSQRCLSSRACRNVRLSGLPSAACV